VAQRRNSFKHPRRAGNGKRKLLLLVLAVLLVVIAVLFVLLDGLKKGRWGERHPSPVVETHSMPQRGGADYPQGAYSSAQTSQPLPPKEKLAPARHGKLAIIVDDMGSSMKDAERLLAIDIPLTFSVIPGLANSRKVANAAHARGRGVMIHMPMEPQGYPGQRLESNGLLVSQGEGEITARVEAYLKDVPHATGANNHMGSGFTEHEDKMQPVLEVLKKNGLYFVDSKTSSRSVGYPMAVRMGIQAGTRNVFLDNDQNVAKVKEQLAQAATLAAKRGGVIAICHPHAGTIQALEEMMPKLHKEGITFVTAAQIVR